MRIEKRKITELLPADYNPRKDLRPGDPEFEKLKRSVQEFGLVEPVIFNQRTRTVVGGHQRLKVLQELGETETDAVIVDLPEDKEKALNIALNKITGEWDPEKLNNLIFELSDAAFDVTLTGFDQDEIDQIVDLRKVELGEADEDDYQEPEELPTRTQPGDVWILGEHALICGDATDPETIRKIMGDTQADLLLTDPPYNVKLGTDESGHAERPSEMKARHRRTDGKIIENDAMEDGAFVKFLTAAFSAAKEVMRPGAAFYIWHASTQVRSFLNAAEKSGLEIRQHLVWVKNTFALGRQDYQWRHEPCLYGWKEGAGHYFTTDRNLSTVIEDPVPDFGKMKKEELRRILEAVFSEEFPTTVLHENKPAASKEHPTMKPIKLMARQIANSTRPGQTVLDIFGGSGSTLIAAEQLKRRCRMVEIDPHYCDVIVDRWEKLTGKKGEKDNARH